MNLINLKTFTTITHYASIIPIMKYTNTDILLYRYRNVIFISSSLSLICHSYNEPMNVLYYIDYSGALIWFIFDLFLAIKSYNKITMIKFFIINFLILFSNLLLDTKSINYNILHSSWHILSAMKCYYISKSYVPKIMIQKLTNI
jgi:hypothetical protein